MGCNTPPENSITDIREYEVIGNTVDFQGKHKQNDRHVVVGVGTRLPDGRFEIRTPTGNIWVAGYGLTVTEKPLNLESFKRVTDN
jgi:hypothetical protein